MIQAAWVVYALVAWLLLQRFMIVNDWVPLAILASIPVIVFFRKPIFRSLRWIAAKVWRRLRRKPNLDRIDLDHMSWSDFEQLVGRVFEARGYKVTYTKRSADQGLDVIAESKAQRVGIQCKRYSGSVGNDAVMAAIAGSKFYQCNRTMVVCTSTFTRAAIELADTTGVELWNRVRLESELRWL